MVVVGQRKRKPHVMLDDCTLNRKKVLAVLYEAQRTKEILICSMEIVQLLGGSDGSKSDEYGPKYESEDQINFFTDPASKRNSWRYADVAEKT